MKIKDILNEKIYSDGEILSFVDSEIDSLKKQGAPSLPDRRSVLSGMKQLNRTAKGRNMSLSALFSATLSDNEKSTGERKPNLSPDFVDADEDDLRRDKLGRILRAKRYYQDQIKNAPTQAGRLAARAALNKIFSLMDRNQ